MVLDAPRDIQPRAFFVGLDPKRYRSLTVSDWELENERQLKVLLLTKRLVVTPASHMGGSRAFQFFLQRPELLRTGAVVPALRADKQSVSDYVRGGGRRATEARAFFASEVTQAVRWEHAAMCGPFGDRLESALRDPRSVLRQSVDLAEHHAESLAQQVQHCPLLSREDMADLTAGLSPKSRANMRRFVNLAYYQSGAQGTEAESVLSPAQFVDYSLPQLIHGHTSLQPLEVFWKLFVEQVLQSMFLPPIPLEILDILSIDEVLAIRGRLLETTFPEQYEAVLDKALALTRGISNGSPAEVAHQLLSLRAKAQSAFAEALDSQRREYLAHRSATFNRRVAFSGASVVVAAVGLVPGLGTVTSAVDVVKSGRELVSNIQTHRFETHPFEARQAAIVKLIAELDIEEKTALYDAVNMLRAVLSEKLSLGY